MSNIIYSTNKKDIKNLSINGFFEGWPNKPSDNILKESIIKSSYTVLAIDIENKKLVGYINAISDTVLSAYIPFLEVLPLYQNKASEKH